MARKAIREITLVQTSNDNKNEIVEQITAFLRKHQDNCVYITSPKGNHYRIQRELRSFWVGEVRQVVMRKEVKKENGEIEWYEVESTFSGVGKRCASIKESVDRFLDWYNEREDELAKYR